MYKNKKTNEFEGIFVAVWRQLVKTKMLNEEETEEYWKTRKWFEDNLPIPPLYDSDNTVGAITWYKPNERSEYMLNRMEFYFRIAIKYGLEIHKEETSDPGCILYEDEYQVAAKRANTICT